MLFFFIFSLLFGEMVHSEICTFRIAHLESNSSLGNITFTSPLYPSPSLVTFKYCVRNRISPELCQVVYKYYHTFCLKDDSEPNTSDLEMLYFISFENPMRFQIPINLNSLIPLHLTEQDFIQTINSLLDLVIFTTPLGMASIDLFPEDCFHLTSTLDYTQPPYGAFLEFGSFSGLSALIFQRYFLTHPGFENSILYGFDSFFGLPEDWADVLPVGMFNRDGIPPYDETEHIRWNIGLFNVTVPPFLASLAASSTHVSFMHIDCDLYSSTSVILSSLIDHSDQLIPENSCIILLFNELVGYPSYEDHEIKAFHEFYHQLTEKHRETLHIVLELLPRLYYVGDWVVGFRLCLFSRLKK